MATLYWYQAAATYAWDNHGTPGPWWDDANHTVQNTVGPISSSAVIMLGNYAPTAGPASGGGHQTIASLDATGLNADLTDLSHLTITGNVATGHAGKVHHVYITSCADLSMGILGYFAAGTAATATFQQAASMVGTAVVTGLAQFNPGQPFQTGNASLQSGTVGSMLMNNGGQIGGTCLGQADFTGDAYMSGGYCETAKFTDGTELRGTAVCGSAQFSAAALWTGGTVGTTDMTAIRAAEIAAQLAADTEAIAAQAASIRRGQTILTVTGTMPVATKGDANMDAIRLGRNEHVDFSDEASWLLLGLGPIGLGADLLLCPSGGGCHISVEASGGTPATKDSFLLQEGSMLRLHAAQGEDLSVIAQDASGRCDVNILEIGGAL